MQLSHRLVLHRGQQRHHFLNHPRLARDVVVLGQRNRLVQDVVQRRARGADDALQGLGISLREGIGVFAIRQPRHPHVDLTLREQRHFLQVALAKQRDVLQRRRAPRPVAIQHQHHVAIGPEQPRHLLHLRLGQRRAHRRHGVVKAVLVQRDDIEVALDHHHLPPLPNRLPRGVQAKQVVALFVQRRLGRVDVLGALGLARPTCGIFGSQRRQHPPAKRNHIAQAGRGLGRCAHHRYQQRKHHALAEAVVVAVRGRRSPRSQRRHTFAPNQHP